MSDVTTPSTPGQSDDQPGVFVRYLMACPSPRLLIHGVGLQILAVVASFAASSLAKPDQTEQLTPWERMLSLSWGLSFLSNALNLAGWAMVIFACGKVVAESIKECRR